MFIELAECLRCPEPHEEQYCVVASETVVGRDVQRGTVGCPVCHAEYPVRDGVVLFGEDPVVDVVEEGRYAPVPAAEVLQATLELSSPGGYVVMVGSVCSLGPVLAGLAEVHCVCVNPQPVPAPSPAASLVRAPRGIPLRTSVARGVVLGAEFARGRWLPEAVRVLRGRHRLVIVGEGAAFGGVRELLQGDGLWVGERTLEPHSA